MGFASTAIILCAGSGSRMGSSENINKCAIPFGGTTSVRHVARALLEAGAKHIAAVVGYAKDSVCSALAGIGASVGYVPNEDYDFHGCNYSVACGVLHESVLHSERVLIAEGDSLLHMDNVREIVTFRGDAAALVRQGEYVDYSKSVMAIGYHTNAGITRFAYNTDHSNAPPEMAEGEAIIGESMQLWSFSGSPLQELRSLLREYKHMADLSSTPMMESGVYSINMLTSPITPVRARKPDGWINMNTPEDLRKAGSAEWLLG